MGTVVGMRIRTLAAAAGTGALLVLAGCVGAEPLPTLPPEPTSTPIFASEEDALAAAEEAYAAYLEMSNLISSEGGVEPERIAPFVTEDQLADELDGSAYLESNQIRTVGASVLNQVELQQYDELDAYAEIVFYACVDVSGVRVLDSAGQDVTPSERAPTIALEVVVQAGTEEVLVADSAQWPDSGFCF